MISNETVDGVSILVLESGRLNMIDREVLTTLRRAIEDSSPAAPIVLTSAGRAFSAGFDLQRILEERPSYTQGLLVALDDLIETIMRSPVPVIAAMPGHAIGAGYIIAAACDRRIGVGGRVGIPESRVGFPMPPGSLELLRSIFPTALPGLLHSGRLLDCDDALALGLIDERVNEPDLIRTATRTATAWGAGMEVFGMHKRLLAEPVLERVRRAREGHQTEVAAYWTSDSARVVAAAYLKSLGAP